MVTLLLKKSYRHKDLKKIKKRNIKTIFEEMFNIWKEINNNIDVITDANVPGANLTCPIPKKVTKSKFILLIIFDYRSYNFRCYGFSFSN